MIATSYIISKIENRVNKPTISNNLDTSDTVEITLRTKEQIENSIMNGFEVLKREWADEQGIMHFYFFIRVKWDDLMKLNK